MVRKPFDRGLETVAAEAGKLASTLWFRHISEQHRVRFSGSII